MATATMTDRSVVDELAQIAPLTTKEFRLFQRLVRRETGINLSDAKRMLLVGRLSKRLRSLGIRSFGSYYDFVTQQDVAGGELREMINCLCTNETEFFREPSHFELIAHTVVPRWKSAVAAGRRPRQVRAWSAGCSTGEEPYSLAMTLLHHLGADNGWSIQILATDLSTRALERARSAVWPIEKANLIPATYRRQFVLKGVRSRQGMMRVGPHVRRVVELRQVNLVDAEYPVSGPFDLVLCRNVCIYFDADTKAHVINRLIDVLAPDGYLFLGHAESIIGVTNRVRVVMPSVYTPASQLLGGETRA